MNDIDFCQRIIEKCRQQQWYGPDIYLSSMLKGEEYRNGTTYWYDRNNVQYPLNYYTDIQKIPTAWAFEYSPATEEQLQSAERLIGFSLPSLLRTIYIFVADGGFGPGYGLFRHETVINSYVSSKRTSRSVDFQIFEKQTSDKKVTMIPYYVWPEGFLCLCDWGCAIYSYLDMATGRVFREAYCGDDRNGFEVEAPTLEVWVELWLAKGIGMFN